MEKLTKIVLVLTLLIRRDLCSQSIEKLIKIAKRQILDSLEIQKYSSRPQRSLSSQYMHRRNLIFDRAYFYLMTNDPLNNAEEANKRLLKIFQRGDEEISVCSERTLNCNATLKYRSFDGSCNNLNNPSWGSAGSSFTRLVKSAYSSWESLPINSSILSLDINKSETINPLPNVRKVSTSIHPDRKISSSLATHMLTQFGQFLDHDISLTPESHVDHCCSNPSDKNCFPIVIPNGDSFFSLYDKKCLDFSRSEKHCSSAPREQYNAITSFIDASNVYGSETLRANALRFGYLLKSTANTRGKELLPFLHNAYTAGDIRAVEMPGLATMHTVFLREHNRIANSLKEKHDSWSDEIIFQETRRIVAAEMQNIVYGQYLNAIIGEKIMKDMDLNLTFPSTYSPLKNPGIHNSFATAAFRFGHSMIQADVLKMGLSGNVRNVTSYKTMNHFFNMQHYLDNDGEGMEEIIHGLINQPAQSSDRFIISDLTNFLFNKGNKFGSDLVSRNLQRGRDHGLPPYGHWRELCKLSPLSGWEERPKEIESSHWRTLKKMYVHPNDIDLFTAGLIESNIRGSVLGQTFSCIITKQFKALKEGDRFFFTHQDQVGSFTPLQLRNLKTRTLGQIICDNTDLKEIRKDVFLLNSKKINCSTTSSLDIQLF